MRKFLFLPLLVLLTAVGLSLAHPARAATLLTCTGTGTTSVQDVQDKWIRLQVSVPGVTASCLDSDGRTEYYVEDMSTYIAGLYKYFVGIIGILAAVMVFFGGVKWLTAAGNASRVKEAKETIYSALIAVVLAFGSYLLLYTISPNLVNLRPPVLKVTLPVEQAFLYCPTETTCQGGVNEGKHCQADTECPGSICSYGVDLTTSSPKSTKPYPYCGSSYALTQTASSSTCLGIVCPDTTSELGTATKTLRCMSAKDNANPPTEGNGKCVNAQSVCENISSSSSSGSTCAQYSVPGLAMCGFHDSPLYRIGTDHCYWRHILTCPNYYKRVGCGALNNTDVSCSNVRHIEDIDLSQIVTGIVGYPSQCDATAAEDVYFMDLTANGHSVQAIACQKTYCKGGPHDSEACNIGETFCGTGTCQEKSVPTASDLQCIADV